MSSLAVRILRLPLTRLILAFVWIGIVGGGGQALLFNLWEAGFPEIAPIWGLFPAAAVIAVSWLAYGGYVRVVERRRTRELALEGAPRELGAGVAVGSVLFTLVVAAIWLTGGYTVIGVGTFAAFSGHLVRATLAGWVEELLFRGILFRITEEGLGSWWALAISSGFFGLAHAGNPNATLYSSLAITIEAGILLGAAYMLTRRLWMAVGLHFSWNLMQGGVFGIAVSGGGGSGLLRSRLEGPELLTGGEFGAEASVFAVAFCLALGLLILWRAVSEHGTVPPFWRRDRAVTGRTAPP